MTDFTTLLDHAKQQQLDLTEIWVAKGFPMYAIDHRGQWHCYSDYLYSWVACAPPPAEVFHGLCHKFLNFPKPTGWDEDTAPVPIEIEFEPTNDVSSTKACTCELLVLMRDGCQCGGV